MYIFGILYPEWGGANQGVYPKGEYGKALAK